MNKNVMVFFDIDYTLFDTDVFKKSNLADYVLYDEVLDVLGQLKNIAVLGIFSEGDLDFQRIKLFKTEIQHHFVKKHVHIVTKKEKSIGKMLDSYKNESIILVDDKLSVLHQAKGILSSIFTVWVKRGIYAVSQKPIDGFTPDAIIENLRDLIPIVEKRK